LGGVVRLVTSHVQKAARTDERPLSEAAERQVALYPHELETVCVARAVDGEPRHRGAVRDLPDLLGSARPRRGGEYVTGSGRIASGACSARHAPATASAEATEDAGGDE
jgi:hypothetical protein